MGKREQHDRAKKILYNREKRTLLLRSYGEKDPTLAVPSGNNFARIVTHYMDISGTREADEKNIRMIREAQSVEGRRRLFARYLKEMRAVDLSVYFSSDIEKVLDYEEKHPSIFYMGFDSTYMIGGMTGGLALNERSRSRLAIAHRLHAYARVLKDPEAYAARAEQQRSEKAMRQNASRPDSGVSLA